MAAKKATFEDNMKRLEEIVEALESGNLPDVYKRQGAVPVSMTTMKTVCDKYRYSKLAFFVVPVIGGFLSNITNAIIITWFINFCACLLYTSSSVWWSISWALS